MSETWYTSARTSFADPVLDRRLRAFMATRGAPTTEAALRGAVFDLVTGSKSARDALSELVPPEDQAEVAALLDREPDLGEVRAALIAVGREREAAALGPQTSLDGGEFEARQSRGPARLASAPATSTPEPAASARSSAGLDADRASSDQDPSVRDPAEAERSPRDRADADRDPSGRAAPRPEVTGSAVARELRELRAVIDLLQARVEHTLSLVKLTAFAAVGILILIAIAALID